MGCTSNPKDRTVELEAFTVDDNVGLARMRMALFEWGSLVCKNMSLVYLECLTRPVGDGGRLG